MNKYEINKIIGNYHNKTEIIGINKELIVCNHNMNKDYFVL